MISGAPLDYLILRALRRLAPQKIVDWMLDRGVYLRPARDTRLPEAAVRTYCDGAARSGQSIEGKRVLVFGYGGGLGIALALLESGARHVCLQDPFAPVRGARNRALPADRMTRFFRRGAHGWQPDPDRVTIVREHLPDLAARREATVDWVVSNSVFEHVADVEANIAACARLTRPGGINLHKIDLRDHFFKYPFEMLCYSNWQWAHIFNTSSNLNRWRLPQYQTAFARHFDDVRVEVLLSLPDQFALAKKRIRPGFLSGNDAVDAAGLIWIEAQRWDSPRTDAAPTDGGGRPQPHHARP